MLSRQELLDIWQDQYGDTACPFVRDSPDPHPPKQVMWIADIQNLDIYQVDAYCTDEPEIVWVPSLGNRYITETVIFCHKEQAAALIYNLLAEEFHRLIAAKEHLDAKVK